MCVYLCVCQLSAKTQVGLKENKKKMKEETTHHLLMAAIKDVIK